MGIKVLLVEDDRALREALADTLLLAGHDYKAVGSAEEALEAVGARRSAWWSATSTCRAWTAISCSACCARVSRNCRCC
jgi:CheY-like chemotaxis protein